jgi:hypothetical protein
MMGDYVEALNAAIWLSVAERIDDQPGIAAARNNRLFIARRLRPGSGLFPGA